MMKTTVINIINQKGSNVSTIPVDVSVADAVKIMNDQLIGSVVVMDGEKLVGIFTERDVLYRVVGKQLDPKKTPLAEVMTANVNTIGPGTTIEEAMVLITEKRCRHLPVLEEGKLIGMISSGDVTRWIASIHQIEAQNLMQYITGGYPE